MLKLVVRAACAAQSLFLLVVLTPLAWHFGDPLRDPGDPRPADAIAVFSSGQIDETFVTLDAAQRLLGGLDLWRRGFAPVLVPSGGDPAEDRRQAELGAAWLERAGVPPEALAVEDRSTRTYESVVALKALMAARGWTSVVIVSSDLDIARIRMVCGRLGVPATYLGVPEARAPVPGSVLYLSSGYAVWYHAMYEYAAIALYWWKGWL